MLLYFVKTPRFVKLLFRKWIWNFSRSEKCLYLTFDDGPTEKITSWVLDELDKYNAKATFFCLGKNVSKNKDLFEDILNRKHSVGNHTYDHMNGWNTKTSHYFANVEKTTAELWGMQSIFRPPYGNLTYRQSQIIQKSGLKIVGWDVLSADFDRSISAEKCLENVIRNVENGSILVFHDSQKAAEKLRFVLPQILEYYHSKNFKFKKIEA